MESCIYGERNNVDEFPPYSWTRLGTAAQWFRPSRQIDGNDVGSCDYVMQTSDQGAVEIWAG